jgi:tRNA nucleotidyltransferase (CCA-adding enzyme)
VKALLVGGAVRDRLLGRAPGERDFVVLGETPESMLAAGFRPVGRDFPVFLHPETGEEYALARTERKSGRGHTGFVFHADPSVTLEEDLRRRDLTVNAMAEDAEGRLIDPWGGRADLEARLLRHVSPAFVEDPLRVLRVARFAAELASWGFRVAPETTALMRAIAASGELSTLSGERVWRELARALAAPRPSRFLQVLREAGALAAVLPEVDALYGVPQVPEYHPEIDTGDHLERVLDQAARLAPGDTVVGFACLVHDLGKGVTPAELLPRHPGHERTGLPRVEALAARVRAPREHLELGRLVCAEHLNVHRALELRPGTLVDLLERLDAFRRPERFAQALLACEADRRGRLGREHEPYPQRDWLQRCLEAASAVDAGALAAELRDGTTIRARLREARARALAALDPP